MAKFILFDTDGMMVARYVSDFNGEAIPAGAVEVTDTVFNKTINETDGIWTIDGAGKIKKIPLPEQPPSTLTPTLQFLNSLSEQDRISLVELTMKDAASKLWYDTAILSGIVDTAAAGTVTVLDKLP